MPKPKGRNKTNHSNEISSITNNNNDPNWKAFKHDTEAGRLLSRLYGVQSNENKINYPVLKKKKGEKLDNRLLWNQKKQERTQASTVRVPKVGQARRNIKTKSLVASIPRRKTRASCQNELKENLVLSSNYRPPTKVTSVTLEKDRLCELHEYGGGSALPSELLMPKQALPSDTKKKKDMAMEMAKAQQRRRARNNEAASEDESLSESEDDQYSLVDQIVKEIQDRQQFQIEMEQSGTGISTRSKIVKEITMRMKELMKLDPEKAKQLAKGTR